MNPVAVGPDTVVSLKIEMYDAQGALLQAGSEPVTYLHGGYGGLLEALEAMLEGKHPGESIKVQLEPEQAFGEYDANHPLAGMALRFFCTITAVREATKEELNRREAFHRRDP